MLTYMTDPEEIRSSFENKTIVSVEVKNYEYHGLSALRFTLDDGSVLTVDCRERNGGAILEVDKS